MRKKKQPPASRNEILRLWNEGYSQLEISEKLNYGSSAVSRHLVLSGVRQRNRNPFTEEEKQQIIQQYKEGATGEELIKKFDKGHGTLYRLLRKMGVTRNLSDALRKYTVDHNAFSDAESNPEAAYWVGFLMADGNVGISKKGQHSITLGLSEVDYNHIVKFRDFLKCEYPISTKEFCKGFSKASRISKIHITSQKLVEDLHRYGVVPNKSLTAESKLLEKNPHFWRGMIDGDGWVSFWGNRPRIGLTGSLRIIEQFVAFAEPIIGKKMTINKNHSIWVVSTTGKWTKPLIKFLYDCDGTKLQRKWEIVQKCLEWKSRKRGDIRVR